MSNKKIGNTCEQEVSDLLRSHHYYVYKTGGNRNGSQPVDLIVLKDKENWLIDVKHVDSAVSFNFERIEDNQKSALSYATNYCHIENCGFAIKFDRVGEIYYLPYKKYLSLVNLGEKSVKYENLDLLKKSLT